MCMHTHVLYWYCIILHIIGGCEQRPALPVLRQEIKGPWYMANLNNDVFVLIPEPCCTPLPCFGLVIIDLNKTMSSRIFEIDPSWRTL